jgi:hypothetical protein
MASPLDRVIGSSNALRYQEDEGSGNVVYRAEPDVFDDGPAKPVRIWSRIGRRPHIAVGNSNGDIPMMQFAGGPWRPALRLLILHDDKEREFDYISGAERSPELAKERGWIVVSIKNDWTTVWKYPRITNWIITPEACLENALLWSESGQRSALYFEQPEM